MKKLIALLMVCGFAFAFVACGGKTAENAETTDSTTTTETPVVEPAPADSADSAAVNDSIQ